MLVDSLSSVPDQIGNTDFYWPTTIYETKVEFIAKWNDCYTFDSNNNLEHKNGEIIIADNNGEGYVVTLEVLRGSTR